VATVAVATEVTAVALFTVVVRAVLAVGALASSLRRPSHAPITMHL
jgi:hypothetical protein